MGRLSEVFGSSTEQLEYKLQIDILEHTVHSVSTVCTSPEAITYRQGAPFQHKLPYGCCSFYMSNLCNDTYEVCNGKVHDMCKTGKAILFRTEAINAIGMKCCLDVVAGSVVVTGIVSS
jgi:hypothetical protein